MLQLNFRGLPYRTGHFGEPGFLRELMILATHSSATLFWLQHPDFAVAGWVWGGSSSPCSTHAVQTMDFTIAPWNWGDSGLASQSTEFHGHGLGSGMGT